jgi:tetratricopeptide (TPR) repeat protein
MDDIDETEKDFGDEEEYKAHANLLKDEGNAAFQAGDVQKAINLFTQAIQLDPDNHVFYSNRAAAFMKADSKSKALHDAEKCLELAPDFVKGYSRLGAAQQSLKRFEAAKDTFKKGIEFDPNNKSLWAALKACEQAHEADKKRRFSVAAKEREVEAARLKRQSEIKAGIAKEKIRAAQEDKEDNAAPEVFLIT